MIAERITEVKSIVADIAKYLTAGMDIDQAKSKTEADRKLSHGFIKGGKGDYKGN